MRNRARPCINYDIGLCFAPCKELISREEYSKQIKQALLFLKGRQKELLTVLNESQQELDNVIVKVQFPQEVIYKDELKIDNVLFSGDIMQGINIGFLSSGVEKRITFEAQVSSLDEEDNDDEFVVPAFIRRKMK